MVVKVSIYCLCTCFIKIETNPIIYAFYMGHTAIVLIYLLFSSFFVYFFYVYLAVNVFFKLIDHFSA